MDLDLLENSSVESKVSHNVKSLRFILEDNSADNFAHGIRLEYLLSKICKYGIDKEVKEFLEKVHETFITSEKYESYVYETLPYTTIFKKLRDGYAGESNEIDPYKARDLFFDICNIFRILGFRVEVFGDQKDNPSFFLYNPIKRNQ